ncbi:MAG TPA: response regulator transcription factor [Acidimicrobiales bacterium]|nr:response regulator transcription factor [Acidimicrobiales bacterium]
MAETTRILLIDDDGPMCHALRDALRSHGHVVSCANSEVEAVARLASFTPSLVLLNLSVQGGNGLLVCRRLHEMGSTPIILIARPGDEADVLTALDVGATDYVVRPLSMEELVTRIASVTCRERSEQLGRADVLEAGPLAIHLARRTVAVRDREVHFTRREYDLLVLLVARPGHIRTRAEILDSLWGGRRTSDTKTLDVHIRRLRGKIERDQQRPECIITVRGVGYYFDPQEGQKASA